MMDFRDSKGRYVKGIKHGPLSEETKNRISLAQIGKKLSKETKIKIGNANIGKPSHRKGKHLSEEHIKNLSNSHKGQVPWMKGRNHSEKSKLLIGIKSKGNKYRLGKSFSKETLIQMSKSHKGQVPYNKGIPANSKERLRLQTMNIGRKHSQEFKNEKKERWNRPEYKLLARERRAKQIFPIKDTKIEVKIQDYLNQLGIFFNTHRYLDILHNYQTDIFIPSLKLVIECDGDYWHANPLMFPSPNDWQKEQIELDYIRTKELKEKGYNVLRLWENEIKKMSLEEFKNKMDSFK